MGRWAGRIRGRAGASAGAETGEQVEVQEAEGVRASRGCLGAWLCGPGVRERAQPPAALQQDSWGVAGRTVPQAVCLLRVRGHM